MTLFNHNYRKILGKVNVTLERARNTNTNGCQAIEHALLEIEKLITRYQRTMVAISVQDELFKLISVVSLKEIANKAISKYQLVLFKPPKFLKSKNEINEMLMNHHMRPMRGHIGQYRLYLKLREHVAWKNMKNDIKNFVKNCEKCKINKIHGHTKEPTVITTTPRVTFDRYSRTVWYNKSRKQIHFNHTM